MELESRLLELMVLHLLLTLAQAEVVLITTPDPVFAGLKAADFVQGKSLVTVVDFWRFLDQELSGKANIRYIPFFGGCSGRMIDVSRLYY